MIRKKEIKDGPLFAAMNEARGPLERRRAMLTYRENLAAASIEAKAWRHGGFLFLALCILCFAGSVVGFWRDFPGDALIPWATMVTSFFATYMSARSSRLLRRAIAGWPWHPS